jgi:dTDP-4-amino-4,6-dideoxygalactose transaminase
MTLDIGARDLGAALANSVRRLGVATRRLEAEADGAVAVLSVRTGFDLWLRAMAFPRGAEIAMSAVTLPDMARIVRHHGLVPVPIDLDPLTMAPSRHDVEAALTDRTCAIVIAHLYGGRVRLGPIAEVARRAGVPLVEDCAQVYAGGPIERHPGAALSLYSFGPIKTATALGGGLACVRDTAVRERMRALQARYPAQSRAAFASRALKYAALVALSHPRAYAVAVAAAAAVGEDSAALAKRLSRGFSGAMIVPVGVSGAPAALAGGARRAGGTIRLQFGAPYRPPRIPGLRAFQADSELTHRSALAAAAAELTARIDVLLEPAYRLDPAADEPVTAVARFV